MTLMETKKLRVRRGKHLILQDLSLKLETGRCLAVVGESGSGKSTLLKAICGLIPFEAGGLKLFSQKFNAGDRRNPGSLSQNLQMVFQDPNSSLDPRWRAEQIVTETLVSATQEERRKKALKILMEVGLDASVLSCLPEELSGGQKQRLGIARALISNPSLLLLDEPVSALDTSVQAGVLNLLADLKEERELTYLFVSHDLAVVRFLADEIAVLKDGKLVEMGSPEDVIENPQSDYTKKLIEAARLFD